MPLAFSTEQLSMIRTAAAPLPPAMRSAFLHRLAELPEGPFL
jgi:hypothetical protein